jgi:hypothetical protein
VHGEARQDITTYQNITLACTNRYKGKEDEKTGVGLRDDSYLNALKELQSTAQQQDEKVAALLLKRKEDAEIERKWGSKGDTRELLLLDADEGGDPETKETDDQEADDAQWFSDDEDETSSAQLDKPAQASEPEVMPHPEGVISI